MRCRLWDKTLTSPVAFMKRFFSVNLGKKGIPNSNLNKMKSLNVKKAFSYLPESLLFMAITISFFGELIQASRVNYLLIICAMILSILIIWKNKYFALTLSILLGTASVYMLLAVFSEYHEFPAGDVKGFQLLFIGVLVFTSLLAVAILLPRKYFTMAKY